MAAPTRVVLLSGEPFDEPLVRWWNFVARGHKEVAEARAPWQPGSDRFGEVEGCTGGTQHLPAPPLSPARIRARVQPPGALDRGAWG